MVLPVSTLFLQSRELTTFRVGLVSFALAAFVDNLARPGCAWPAAAERRILGLAVLIGCLGTVVTRRIFENVSLDRELIVARKIQEALLPVATPRLGAIADRMLDEAGAWSGASPSDDLTLVVVECA
jgi:hypothetical protein